MPLSVPSEITWTVGQTVTAAQLNTNLRDGINYLLNPPLFIAHQAAAQSLTTATFTDLNLDTTDLDTYAGHSGTSPTYTFQAAGYYEVAAGLGFSTSSAGRRIGLIVVAGGAAIAGGDGQIEMQPTNGGGGTTLPYVWYVNAPVGGTVKVQGYQSSGGALTCALTVKIRWVHA